MFKCISKRIEKDLTVSTYNENKREQGGEFVIFGFMCEELNHGIRVANVTGPFINSTDGKMQLMITDPKDFDRFEIGKTYFLQPT